MDIKYPAPKAPGILLTVYAKGVLFLQTFFLGGHMNMLAYQLKALRMLCEIACDELQKISQSHELLVYRGINLTTNREDRLRRYFFTNFGPKDINQECPSDEDKLICLTKYRFALLTAVIIEKARLSP